MPLSITPPWNSYARNSTGVGASMSSIILAALIHVWESLAVLKTPMAVAGGLAVGIWKNPRATRDVDLLIAVDPPAPSERFVLLGKAGLFPRTATTPLEIGGLRLVLLNYRPPGSFLDLHVDLLFADTDYHRIALGRAITTSIPGSQSEVRQHDARAKKPRERWRLLLSPTRWECNGHATRTCGMDVQDGYARLNGFFLADLAIKWSLQAQRPGGSNE